MINCNVLFFLSFFALLHNTHQQVRIPISKREITTATSIVNNNRIFAALNRMGIKNYNNFQYMGKIYIGPKYQLFEVLIDTGSANLWIPHSSCKNLDFIHRFDCQKSTTCQDLNLTSKLEYGSGNVAGNLVIEQVSLGNKFDIKNQIIMLATNIEIDGVAFDGILGLGFTSLADGIPTFLDNLKDQNIIKSKVFSLYLKDNFRSNGNIDSELIIGGYDAKYMLEPKFTFYNVVSDYYWAISLKQFMIGNFSLNIMKNTQVLIDSGTSLMVIPFNYFRYLEIIFNAINPGCQLKEGMIFCPCNGDVSEFPIITINFENFKNYYLTPEDYIIVAPRGICIIGIEAIDDDQNLWIFGDMFLNNVYTIFDMDNKVIGFSLVNPRADKMKSKPFLIDPNDNPLIDSSDEDKSTLPSSNENNGPFTGIIITFIFIIMLWFYFCRNNNFSKRTDHKNLRNIENDSVYIELKDKNIA